MKKILSIAVIFIFIFTNLSTVSAITKNQVDKNKEFLALINGQPDLIIYKLMSWWSSSQEGLYLSYHRRNIGDNEEFDEIVYFNIEIYADGELISSREAGSTLNPASIIGYITFYDSEYITQKPNEVTVLIDSTNTVEESNEENNVCTVDCPEEIVVYGNVEFKNNNHPPFSVDYIKPLFNFKDYSVNSALPDNNGDYVLSIPPEPPYDVAHKYKIQITDRTNPIPIPITSKETEEVMMGESINLDFYVKEKSKINYFNMILNQIYEIFPLFDLIRKNSLLHK